MIFSKHFSAPGVFFFLAGIVPDKEMSRFCFLLNPLSAAPQGGAVEAIKCVYSVIMQQIPYIAESVTSSRHGFRSMISLPGEATISSAVSLE